MGNCQAAEAATVLIHHPGSNKVERIYRSLNAQQVMSSNPGYYVAMIVTNVPAAAVRDKKGSLGAYKNADQNVRQLKLLKPDDTLHIGHVYRLVSFEDVLKEFSAKKSVKLGKLLKENNVAAVSNISCTGFDKRNRKQRKKMKKRSSQCNSSPNKKDDEQQVEDTDDRGLDSSIMSTPTTSIGTVSSRRQHQWTPALQTIAEVA